MKKRLTRFMTLFLSFLIAFSLALPALAADGEGDPADPSGPDGGQTTPGEGDGNQGGGDGTGDGTGDGGDSGTVDPPPAAVDPTGFKVELNSTKLSMTLGTPAELTATVTPTQPEGATLDNATLTFNWGSTVTDVINPTSEDDPDNKAVSVATLDPAKAGKTIIKVEVRMTIKGQPDPLIRTAECEVTVNYTAPTDVTLLPSAITLEPNGKSPQTLTASVSPSGADPDAVSWSVRDSDIATLSATSGGSVTISGKNPGTTSVFATVGSGENAKTAQCEVTVKGVKLDTTEISVLLGTSKQLGATPVGGIGTVVEWSSGNSQVAFVSNDGRITGQTLGSTTITAKIGGYSASCTVNVVENTASVITGTATAGQPFRFSDILSSLNSCSRQVLDAPLSYVSNLQVSTSQGILYYGYISPADTGFGVGGSERYYYNDTRGQRSLSDVVFVPLSDFSGTATITYSGSDANNRSFSGTIRITVTESDDVLYTTKKNTAVTFSAADFSLVCRVRNGRDLTSVTFDLPAANRGVLCTGYNSVSGQYSDLVGVGTPFYRARNPYLDNVTLIPAQNYTGTFTIGYTAVDTAGVRLYGRVRITVADDEAAGAEVTYSASAGAAVTFRASDFNDACRRATGSTLDYVRFTLPASGAGTLYYNYRSNGTYDSRVPESNRYYRSLTPSVSNVTFVPANNASSRVFIDFYGYSTNGERFSGKVCIKYPGTDMAAELSYSTQGGMSADFNAADFNEVCQDVTGARLNRVTFTLPNSREGTLYYNYRSSSSSGSRVSANQSFYRSGSPSISSVSFVPASGFTGTTYINYVGYDINNISYRGTIRINVAQGLDTTIYYSAVSGGRVSFDSVDFHNICQSYTDYGLNYVRLTLPSSQSGTLYYNYDANKGTGSRVSSSTNYYRSGSSSLLDNVTFVPAAGYTGTVTINYTGTSSNGKTYTGVVQITVTRPVANVIRYSGGSMPILFQSSDFNQASQTMFGRELSHVQFTTLPSTASGRLYLNYSSPQKTGSPVTTGSYYYYNGSPSLYDVSFVPNADFSGTATIAYTGYDASGNRFNGTVEVTVSKSPASNPFTDMGNFAWASNSVDFLFQYGVIDGIGSSQFSPAQNIRRGDFVLMICRALELDTGSTASFPDVPASSYYAKAIATAKDLGIVSGYNNRFNPNVALTRQDAMVMIYRALGATGRSISSMGGNLSLYRDSSQVSDYAFTAVSALVQAGIIRGDESGLLRPGAYITRAEMAVILHRVLTM